MFLAIVWTAGRGDGYEDAVEDQQVYQSGAVFTNPTADELEKANGDYDATISSLKDGDTLVNGDDYTKAEIRDVIDEVNEDTDFDLNVSGIKHELIARVNDALDVIHS